jgi:integrase
MAGGDTHGPRLAHIPHFSHIALYAYSVTTAGRRAPSPAPVPASSRRAGELIAGYRPPSLSEEAARFARRAAAACAPRDPARAKALLFACGKLGAFASAAGLELDPQVCLHPSVIERFILTAGRDLSAPTRRTLRTNLRYAARRAGPQLGPAPVPLPRQRAKAPYSAAEIAGYLALADAQPTLARRMRAAGLICLGAGAGLTGADLRGVRGSDITCRSGGVVVEVRGRAPRVVPVASRYHDLLLASAGFAGTRLLTGGRDPGRRNVTTPLIRSLAGGTGLPRLEGSRLRATWLAGCAGRLGLATFMHAAGITCSQRLGDLIAALDPADEASAVALLGGTR